nr:hypothetical protein [Burkholderia glumae]
MTPQLSVRLVLLRVIVPQWFRPNGLSFLEGFTCLSDFRHLLIKYTTVRAHRKMSLDMTGFVRGQRAIKALDDQAMDHATGRYFIRHDAPVL